MTNENESEQWEVVELEERFSVAEALTRLDGLVKGFVRNEWPSDAPLFPVQDLLNKNIKWIERVREQRDQEAAE